MAKALGSDALLYVDDNAGFASQTAIENVMSAGFSHSIDMEECTDNDSSGSKEWLPADCETDFEVTMNWDWLNTGQKEVMDAADARTKVYFRYQPNGAGSGKREFTFGAYVESFELPIEHATKTEFTFTAKVDGAITITDLP